MSLDVKKAATIAQGCAASAFDALADSGERNGKAKPPAGRFWASGGDPVPIDTLYAILHALVVYIEREPEAPVEALYTTACAIAGKHRGAWSRRPEAERLAFDVFASVLRPMIAEIARTRRAAAVVALPPPVDKGLFRRAGKIKSTFAKRVVMSHPKTQITEAAE